jgi:hypothetical protein
MENARKIILDMLDGGATKTAIAEAVGVLGMTILSVSQDKTRTFSKLKQLHRVYDYWLVEKLYLRGKRGKKAVVAPVAEETPAGKMATPQMKASAGKEIKAKKAKGKRSLRQ